MNKDLLETQWVQAKEYLRDKWNRLTEEDLRQIDGRFDRLSDKLQQRYGYTSAQAEEEIRRWNIDRSAKAPYMTDKPYLRQDKSITRRDEGSTGLKWLLALALPLLLIALYLGTSRSPTASSQPISAEEIVVYSETPADQNLEEPIRRALISNSSLFQDLRNLRFALSNGTLTVTGTVANAQEKERLDNLLNNISGIRSINNQIEIRQ